MSSAISKWKRTRITQDVMKDFFYMYDCKPSQVEFSEGTIKMVELSEVIPENQDWAETIWRYNGLIKRIEGPRDEYKDSAWWKHEQNNEVKDIQKRFTRFENLYYGIKKNGFKPKKINNVILLNIRDLKRKTLPKGGRISYKYYRINAMKRILICNFLNIRRIPAKVYGVSL